jgi:hypothetical protein
MLMTLCGDKINCPQCKAKNNALAKNCVMCGRTLEIGSFKDDEES